MPTKSFYEPMVIETEEQAELLLRLIEEADNRPKIERSMEILELIERGNRLIEEGYFDKI